MWINLLQNISARSEKTVRTDNVGYFLRSNDIVSFDFSVIRNCTKLYRNLTKIDLNRGPTHFLLTLLFH